MQFKKTRLSEALGRTWGGLEMKESLPRKFGTEGSRVWPISDIINRGVELDQFDPNTWFYSAHFDVVFVQKGSKLYTWLAVGG